RETPPPAPAARLAWHPSRCRRARSASPPAAGTCGPGPAGPALRGDVRSEPRLSVAGRLQCASWMPAARLASVFLCAALFALPPAAHADETAPIAWTKPGSARQSPSRGGAGTLPGSPDTIDAVGSFTDGIFLRSGDSELVLFP